MSRGSIGLSSRLNDYVVGCHRAEHPVLAKLRAETTRVERAFMQIAPEQGHFLAFLVHLIGARLTFEVGTYTGYSALAVALALPPGGRVVTMDVSEEWTAVGRPHWEEAGVADRIELRLAPALDSLAALEKEGYGGRFDLGFIDAEKTEYDAYYEHALRLVRPGGLIVLDNMLYLGGVVQRWGKPRAGTKFIKALNAKIAADPRVEAVLIPLGDGTTLARKL